MNTIQNVYIHVPFCHSKCDYCAFYSRAKPTSASIDAYLDRLQQEMTEKRRTLGTLDTLFIGGGTPSFLRAKELSRLLQIIAQNCSFSEDPECTLECNPESLTKEKISILTSSFINRVSIGIQTFDPRCRRAIGRGGSLVGLDKKISALIRGGIENISFDLIYGIPGQTLSQWQADLRAACTFPIRHISTYALSIEESSRLGTEKKIAPCDDDLAAEEWLYAVDFLAKEAGIFMYEVSNYARAGFECRHNRAFWRGQPYYGFGPAAVSYTGTKRTKNAEDLELWLASKGAQTEQISHQMRARELVALGLRLKDGISAKHFHVTTGFSLHSLFATEITSLTHEGLATFTDEHLVPTEKGLLFADYSAALFI